MGQNCLVTPVIGSGNSMNALTSSHLPLMEDATRRMLCRRPSSRRQRTLTSISSTLSLSRRVACAAVSSLMVLLNSFKVSVGSRSSSDKRFTKIRDDVVMVTRLSSMLRSSWSRAESSALSAPERDTMLPLWLMDRMNNTCGLGPRPTAAFSTPRYTCEL